MIGCRGETTLKTYVYKAELEQDEDGRWSAWVDALPGCAAWGHNQEEALKALRDAAEAYIEDLIESGEAIPSKEADVLESPAVAITV
jgi:predicted RNase H-like HicB family nuclease